MTFAPADPDGLRRALELLRAGHCIGMPTETVYGLAADALNPAALARIFDIKRRPRFDPLILHVTGRAMLDRVAAAVSPAAEILIEQLWPGPLTIILPKRPVVPDLATSGLPNVAVRSPAHPVATALLNAFNSPLAAPSANRFGRISPTTAVAVAQELFPELELVLDGGPCSIGIESTIIDCSGLQPVLRRPGGIPIEIITNLIGPVIPGERGDAIVAPGMLHSHYAPRTPLTLATTALANIKDWPKQTAALAWSVPEPRAHACQVLARDGQPVTAARNLFAAMRNLDHSGASRIIAEPVPTAGLGAAILDRLQRASHHHP